ncbi:MAG: nitroreductase family protein [Pelolinea sp.]|nr:nitroreductase family protein [Pelolinea sp.]
MHTNQDLYKNLLSRHSIRRYKHDLLGKEELLKISNFTQVVESLDDKNIFYFKLFEYQPETPSGKALGGFGRIMNPPYFMAPFINGNINSIVDLGFRTQQIVLDLWSKGIGSCYVGCVHRQNRVKQLLNLSNPIKIISFLIFGLPDKNQSLRLYQKISQVFTRSKKRLSYEELFLDHQLPENVRRNILVKKILEAGRYAPSATNAQPWRFNIKENQFTIFAHQKKIANIYDLEQGYSLHDTGICMANMSKAAQALGTAIRWCWVDADFNKQPSNGIDIPIAFFSLDDLRSNL